MRLSDKELYELISAAQSGGRSAEERLINECRALVKSRARSLFLAGGDTDDLIQEGMIGLLAAIRDYDPDKGSFFAFAQLCVSRRIMSAVKAAARDKHKPLNEYISFGPPGGGSVLLYVPVSSEPEAALIDKENYLSLEKKIRELLTPLESDVLKRYLSGEPYQEIAEALNKDVKAVDNALSRIKRKLR